jgi:hypothetical protein
VDLKIYLPYLNMTNKLRAVKASLEIYFTSSINMMSYCG